MEKLLLKEFCFLLILALKKNLIDENYCFLARDILKKYGFSPLGIFSKRKNFKYVLKKDKKLTMVKIISLCFACWFCKSGC
jgi:hypothetical protein